MEKIFFPYLLAIFDYFKKIEIFIFILIFQTFGFNEFSSKISEIQDMKRFDLEKFMEEEIYKNIEFLSQDNELPLDPNAKEFKMF